MNWIKQNKKLAAILGVMIVGGIALGVFLFLAWSDFSAQMDQWTEMDRKTIQLENSKFTPNAENVALLTQRLEDYSDKFTLLQKVLLSKKLQQDSEPISETEFQAKLKERTKAVTQKAGKMTELPKEFALSFEEYTGTLPANPAVAAELNVQLDVTEKFVNTLLEAGVKSIDSLERTRLPTERGGSAAAAPTPQPAPAPVGGNKKKVAQAPTFAAPVVERHPIKCVFTCDQGPLQNLMNNLANPAKTPQFLAVRQLHVENTKQEAPTKDEIKQMIKPPGTPAAGLPPPSTGDKTIAAVRTVPKVTPAEKDSAEIMGGEMLKVYLEVDYLRFRKPAEEGAADAPATAPAPTKR